MSLEQFVESAGDSTVELAVVNREAPQPVQTMLEGLFDDQSVTVSERHRPDEDEDVVYAIEDGDVVASSSLSELQESILLVNSDLYITGARTPKDLEVPDVITALENVDFRLRGYPESNNEKLLLTTISRHIERLAMEQDGGKHRASFQRLSRVDDENGTRWVYETLADSPVDVHMYGMPDWTPPPEFPVTIHGGWSPEFRDSWFVVFSPPDDDGPWAALVAIAVEPRVWEGFWTFDPETVRRIERYIEREL